MQDKYNELARHDDEMRATQIVEGVITPIPPRSDAEDRELFTQAAGGVNRGRSYGSGLETCKHRITYDVGPSSSNAVSLEQYDQMKTKVQELTEQLTNQKALHQALSTSFEAFKAEMMSKRSKSKKKRQPSPDSTDESDSE